MACGYFYSCKNSQMVDTEIKAGRRHHSQADHVQPVQGKDFRQNIMEQSGIFSFVITD